MHGFFIAIAMVTHRQSSAYIDGVMIGACRDSRRGRYGLLIRHRDACAQRSQDASQAKRSKRAVIRNRRNRWNRWNRWHDQIKVPRLSIWQEIRPEIPIPYKLTCSLASVSFKVSFLGSLSVASRHTSRASSRRPLTHKTSPRCAAISASGRIS